MNDSASAKPRLRSGGKKHKYFWKRLFDFLFLFVFIFAVTFLLHSYVFYTIDVKGESMQPTLYTEDKLLVEKISSYLSSPSRGDIIIVSHPMFEDDLVKRVIALPGETVSIQGGEVYINGNKIVESAYWQDKIQTDMAEVVVPDGSIFVMGDNRNESLDSRSSVVGPIPIKNIEGYVRVVIWPFNRIRLFFKTA